jgi:hypothetical protein
VTKSIPLFLIGLAVALSGAPTPSATLAQSFAPSLTVERLEEWKPNFDTFKGSATEKGFAPQLIGVLNDLNGWIQSIDDIETFRRWERAGDVVRDLVPLAGGEFSETRVPAALVLTNVVDSTNVCYAIDFLAEKVDPNPNGRFNVLQVLLGVASYAYDDTSNWMVKVSDQLILKIGMAEDTQKTRDLILKIKQTALLHKENSGLRLVSESKKAYDACASTLPEEILKSGDEKIAFKETIADLKPELIQNWFWILERSPSGIFPLCRGPGCGCGPF